MAVLKVKDKNGVITEILSIKGKSGKSPIIQDGYWWNYNDTTGEYENTGISVGNLISVGEEEPDTELWIDTSDNGSGADPLEIVFDDSDNGTILHTNGANTDWIKGKRCLVKTTNNFIAVCYLDENNSELFHDGITTASLDGSMGYWMVELPEFYYIMDESEAGKHILKIKTTPDIGWFKSKKTYLGVTKGIITNGKLTSVKGGTPTVDTTILDFHNSATNNGVGFDIVDYETRCKLVYMYFAKFASRNSQDSLVLGTSSTTGTTSSLGNNTGNSSTQHSLFGVEDSFGKIWEMTSGVISNENSCYISEEFHIDSKPNKYREFIAPVSSGYVNKIQYGEHCDIIPLEFGGSSSTGFCDYSIFQNNTTGWNILLVGGNTTDGTKSGLLATSLANDSTYTASDCGSRLQYKGDVQIINDPSEFIAL